MLGDAPRKWSRTGTNHLFMVSADVGRIVSSKNPIGRLFIEGGNLHPPLTEAFGWDNLAVEKGCYSSEG